MIERLLVINFISAIIIAVITKSSITQKCVLWPLKILVVTSFIIQIYQYSQWAFEFRPIGFLQNPNMLGFFLLMAAAVFIHSKDRLFQFIVGSSLFLACPRSFIVCLFVFSLLTGFKNSKYGWLGLLLMCFIPIHKMQLTADRIRLTPIVVYEYITGDTRFRSIYQSHVIGEDKERLYYSRNGETNISERLAEGISDNAYKSYHYLMGEWFWLWLLLFIPPLFTPNWFLKSYYIAAMLSGFTMQIFILNPSWEILAITYGLCLRDKYE